MKLNAKEERKKEPFYSLCICKKKKKQKKCFLGREGRVENWIRKKQDNEMRKETKTLEKEGDDDGDESATAFVLRYPPPFPHLSRLNCDCTGWNGRMLVSAREVARCGWIGGMMRNRVKERKRHALVSISDFIFCRVGKGEV
jgi:hypothetical protein